MGEILLQSWTALARSFILLAGSYVGLIIILRVSGKRTLSKLNAFDLVVTISLGSTLATISLSKDTALMQGLLVLAMLVFLQYAVAWISIRSSRFRKLIKSEPHAVFLDGDFIGEALEDERLTREEVLAAVRKAGITDLDSVLAVVLETDGTLSVLEKRDSIQRLTLQGVIGAETKTRDS